MTTDLFGHQLPEPPVAKPGKPVSKANRHRLPLVVAAEPTGLRRPTGRTAQRWQEHKWKPVAGELTHFNLGSGYDLQARKRVLFSNSFGYILLVNEQSGEVLVHLPKFLIGGNTDQFFVVPFSNLLPPQCVADFDVMHYCKTHPKLECPVPVFWHVNP